MKKTLLALSYAITTVLLTTQLHAQMGPATPAPELKKLDFMAGDWTSEGDMKPGPGMPGGKFSISSHTEWMEGNFFLVEHSNADMAAMGKFKELAVLGYDPDRKVYTYHAFSSMGQDETSAGTVDGDTWTWLSDEHFGGMTMKGRFT
jgi:hypothetical protein